MALSSTVIERRLRKRISVIFQPDVFSSCIANHLSSLLLPAEVGCSTSITRFEDWEELVEILVQTILGTSRSPPATSTTSLPPSGVHDESAPPMKAIDFLERIVELVEAWNRSSDRHRIDDELEYRCSNVEEAGGTGGYRLTWSVEDMPKMHGIL